MGIVGAGLVLVVDDEGKNIRHESHTATGKECGIKKPLQRGADDHGENGPDRRRGGGRWTCQ